MITMKYGDLTAARAWRSRWWFGMLFFQAAKKIFGFRNTALAAVEIVLLAFFGN